ncbi:hypothetical protein BDW74DRAFT_144894, partial [Aspergillus multicolor]|uniref:uncharacterized protein n=1 Tax=Aspergillus multicolor TaxID=41759 RepID=UPI003CCD8570
MSTSCKASTRTRVMSTPRGRTVIRASMRKLRVRLLSLWMFRLLISGRRSWRPQVGRMGSLLSGRERCRMSISLRAYSRMGCILRQTAIGLYTTRLLRRSRRIGRTRHRGSFPSCSQAG